MAVLLSVFAVAYVGVVKVALSSDERIIFAVMSVGSCKFNVVMTNDPTRIVVLKYSLSDLVYLGACMSDWYDWLNDGNSLVDKIIVTHNTYTSTIIGRLEGDRKCLIMTANLSTRWSPKKKKLLQTEYAMPTVMHFN